ncbi:MAG: ThuA domain-containing protein [Flavobacteriaceae bacterium]|uniref:ThuA domain-containing protein n=1 Tax=Flagellimonas sp. SN16 TaxID=3415142 RepID=UPI003C5228FC|nr:ThuA domain-containing protein [Flavobacteriaceae bacterium]
MKSRQFLISALWAFTIISFGTLHAQEEHDIKKTKVFVIGAVDQYHSPMADKSVSMFDQLANENNFELHFTRDTSEINPLNLAQYDVFVQLHVAPFDLSAPQQYTIQQFMEKGKGWIGIHAAGLTGTQFDQKGKEYWKWYEHLLGGVTYSPHPPLQDGLVRIVNSEHPITKGLSASFTLRDEWYEFDQLPAPPVNILAIADESTYEPRKPMGYHPVVWTNPSYDKAVYISIGHHTSSCDNPDYRTLVGNAINWAADQYGKEERQMNSFLESQATILVNQIGYNRNLPKEAVLKSKVPITSETVFAIVDARTGEKVFTGSIGKSEQVMDWSDDWYTPIHFSQFNTPGFYNIQITLDGNKLQSFDFEINQQLISKSLIPAITKFFYGQRADSEEELMGDANVKLFGSETTVDLRGGWCDASGDVSKYFSHLAYTNYMNPQQTPLVDWSMMETVESIPHLLDDTGIKESLIQETFYGADYIMKSLSPEGYFYMTLFSYFKKDPKERRVVGLLADSKTTSDYQSGFREGGGMGVAALARISTWKWKSKYRPSEYLKAAEKAYAHLLKNSTKYIDDHTENILDDYSALMASTELWLATGKSKYQKDARARAEKLVQRQSEEGFFWSDDAKTRPFWHASDAGLPLIALIRYLDAEKDRSLRSRTLSTIKKFIDYQLRISAETANPFQYPRQTFKYEGTIMKGFFIPHENESGWWWQGENARIGSLATALLKGGRLIYPAATHLGVSPELEQSISAYLNWILGTNPYQVCMMYGYGQVNVPYMASMYGHGSGIGGISNGITGFKEKPDGSGIDFRYEDSGNEWRWSEQWIPHTAWFLQALTALESK